MMMPIRRVRKNDFPALNKLLRLYWYSRGGRYSAAYTNRYLKQGHGTEIEDEQFFVATQDGRVVGCISVIFWGNGLAELRDFYVFPIHRAKGIGKELFHKAISECKKRRTRKVFAEVLPDTVGFFEGHGFRQEGFLKNHFRQGENVHLMSRFL